MRCLKIVQEFNNQLISQGVLGLTEEDMRALCEEVVVYLQDEMEDEVIAKVVHYYFYDGPLVKALRDSDHPDHEMYWSQFRQWCYGVIEKSVWHQSYREDFLQDALLHLYKKLSAYDFQKPFRGWAAKVMRNLLFDQLRSQQRRPQTVEGTEEQRWEQTEESGGEGKGKSPKSRPDEIVLQRERQEYLKSFLEALLSDRDLVIVRLSLQKEIVVDEAGRKRVVRLTDADIAQRVGLSPNSIPQTRKRIFRRLSENPVLRELVAELFGEDYLN